MKIAIQQPYFYPYLGFFQLIKQVDRFILFNDVQYIRRGWVNRNRLEEKQFLTVPIQRHSQKSLINQIKIDNTQAWHQKHLKILITKYGKKAINHPLYDFYVQIQRFDYLLDLLTATIRNVCQYLKITTELIHSETFSVDPNLRGSDRIIHICQCCQTDHYLNLPNGAKLYSREEFNKHMISLEFIDISNITNYMSILDICIGDGVDTI